MALALGVDGGGTYTRAIVVDELGRVVGSGDGGPSNYDTVGTETAGRNLREVILQASATCGPRAIDSAFLGVAGVVSESDRRTVRELISGIGLELDVPIGVDHDIRVALAGAAGGAPGIALIVGTGSSCYGRNAAGESWRSGGWGFLLDDLGSAYYLGQQALVAIIRAHDGRGPATLLAPPVLLALDIEDVDDLMRRVYHPRPDRAAIASLAPIVTHLAHTDPVARRIVETGCRELALMVKAVATKLGFAEPFPVTATGGVVDSDADFRTRLETAITDAAPMARIQTARMPPVAGAALLALEQLGIAPAEGIVKNLADEFCSKGGRHDS